MAKVEVLTDREIRAWRDLIDESTAAREFILDYADVERIIVTLEHYSEIKQQRQNNPSCLSQEPPGALGHPGRPTAPGGRSS